MRVIKTHLHIGPKSKLRSALQRSTCSPERKLRRKCWSIPLVVANLLLDASYLNSKTLQGKHHYTSLQRWCRVFQPSATQEGDRFTKQCVQRHQGCLHCCRASCRLGVESAVEVVHKSAVSTRCASEQKENIEICRLLLTNSQSQVCLDYEKE